MTLRTVVLQADFTGCARGGCRETVQSGTELGSAAPGQEAVGLSAGRTGPNCPDRATQHYASAHRVPCVCPGDLGLEKDSGTVVQPFRSHLKRHPQEKNSIPRKKTHPQGAAAPRGSNVAWKQRAEGRRGHLCSAGQAAPLSPVDC